MENKSYNYSLSIKNLKDIPFNKYPKDFTFIVDGKRYQTPRIVADILSPKIRKLHCVDEFINEFYINTKDPSIKLLLHDGKIQDDSDDYFESFLNLCQFENKEYEENIRSRFMLYFYLLGNITEYVHLINNQSKEIMVDNAINRLISILSIESKMDDFTDIDVQNSKEIIKFVASHFEDIDKKQLSDLNVEILDEIFRSDSLIINEEDSLFNFFFTLFEKNISYLFLF